MYSIVYTKRSAADVPKLKSAKLDKKAKALIDLIRKTPYQNPPPYEKLVGDLQGAYSRRINIKHRLVYEVLSNSENIKDENGTPFEGIVKIISLWTHYER